MKKILPFIVSIVAVFISLPAVAMESPLVRRFDTVLRQSDGEVRSFKGENGGNIFHGLFREFPMSGGRDAKLNSMIEDAVRRFPELLLIPDDEGQYATDFVEGSLLPLAVYQALGQRFQASVYNQTPDPDREKFMKDVAPSLLVPIVKGLMVGNEYSLQSQARSKREPEAAVAQQKLSELKSAQGAYDNLVLNGSQILLRVKPKGMGIPLFMVFIDDYQRPDFVKNNCFGEGGGGTVEGFVRDLGNGSALVDKRKEEGRKVGKFINLANMSYTGLYSAFQKGEGYFDRFFDLVKGDPDYNDPRFLDAILYAMSQVGHQKDGETPVVNKTQTDQLLVRFPALSEKIKSFPKPLGGLEAYFDEEIRNQRVHVLLSRARTKRETADPVQFVVSAVSKRWLRLPDYLMADLERGELKTFVDYFRAVSVYQGHGVINPDFWDSLYSNQHFSHARENSAVQAFLIGLDMSLRNRSWGGPGDLEVIQSGVMKALFKKDAEFTGRPESKRLSTTARVVKLITQANRFMHGMGIDGSAEIYQAANDVGFEILNGNNSSHRLNFNRKATRDEFLNAMSFLRHAIQREDPDSLQRKIMAGHPVGLTGDNLMKLQRHRQNVNLCALWLAEEGSTSVSEVTRLTGIAARMSLSVEEAKTRLYRMEDNFAGRGYFIKDRMALESELH